MSEPQESYDEDSYDSDFSGYDDEDSFERQLSNCGMTREGFCMLAGTEYCDWDCHVWDDGEEE